MSRKPRAHSQDTQAATAPHQAALAPAAPLPAPLADPRRSPEDIAAVAGICRRRDGLPLALELAADATGLPVVHLHGFPDSCWSWAPVLPHLPGSIHAYAPSQRGHGDADRLATGYRFEDFAADPTAFMDTLGIERAVIGGHSMGSSYAAQRFAMDHPERVLGLVLVGSVTAWRGNEAITEIWESGIATFCTGKNRSASPAIP